MALCEIGGAWMLNRTSEANAHGVGASCKGCVDSKGEEAMRVCSVW